MEPLSSPNHDDAEALADALHAQGGEPGQPAGKGPNSRMALLNALAAALDSEDETTARQPAPATPTGPVWAPADGAMPAAWAPQPPVLPQTPQLAAEPQPASGLGMWTRPAPGPQAFAVPGTPVAPVTPVVQAPIVQAPVVPVVQAPAAPVVTAPAVPAAPVARTSATPPPPPPPFRVGDHGQPAPAGGHGASPAPPVAPPPPFRVGAPAPVPGLPPVPPPTTTGALMDFLSGNDAVEDAEGSSPLGADVRERAQNSLLEGLGARLYDPSMTEEAMGELVAEHLANFFDSEDIQLEPEHRARLAQEITDDLLRHGPIEPFLADPSVNEVMVNGCRSIYIERKGKLVLTKTQFASEAQLRRVIERIVGRVGRRIDESSPMVDARLPDGSRVNAIVPPLAVDGPTLTIRKFTADGFTIDDLVRTKSVTPEVAGLLEVCVRGRLNVLVSGGTGSGKTTLLNILSSFIPVDERIVTIEDAVELRLRQPHVIRLESRPPNVEGKGAVLIRDLVRNSLRMRPDRIVVGECRGGETLDMLQAMNTGHDGSLSTLHANSPRDALSRIETMVLMAGMDLPVRAIREQVASAVDLIVQVARLRDGSRRVTHLSEVVGMEGEVITMNDVFKLNDYGDMDENGLFTGVMKPTGIRPLFADTLNDRGIRVPEELFGETYGLRLGGRK